MNATAGLFLSMKRTTAFVRLMQFPNLSCSFKCVTCETNVRTHSRCLSSSGIAEGDGKEEPKLGTTGLPEITKEIEQECNIHVPEEELKARKTASVMGWLESQYGRDKVALAKILQRHQVVVRGTQEDGFKLMDALLEWKQQQL